MSELMHANPSAGDRSAPTEKLACLIIGRNLGDAVIQSLFWKDLIARNYAERYLVWTRPQVAFLYQGLPNCEIVTSPFPVGTSKQFDRAGALNFLKAIRTIRGLKPTVTIDLVGDFRERLFARLVGSRKHLHIGWAEDHPFARIIRNPFGAGQPLCVVPASAANVYQAHALFLEALTGSGEVSTPQAVSPGHASAPRGPLRKVGLHPFASQDCKLWPDESWRTLAADLQNAGVQLTAYGAPSDRPALERIFGPLPQPVEYFTKNVPAFAADIATLDLMIGLDSFSVHMAERYGVPSVMLNACNHPTLWVPPGCHSVSASGGCAVYPCMNVPTCAGKPTEYACIKSVTCEAVKQATQSRTTT